MPSEPTMWLSTRKLFREGDSRWDEFTKFVGVSHLSEVRSIDSFLNPCAEGNFPIASTADLWATLTSMRPAELDSEYHLLFVDSHHHDVFSEPCITFLGYDLSDETWTSSLLNCGRWEGSLAELAASSRPNGLLDLAAAKLARQILPTEWDDDPHSNVTIWALYEVDSPLKNG